MFTQIKNTLTFFGKRLVGDYTGHSSEWILVDRSKDRKPKISWKSFASEEFLNLEEAPLSDVLDVVSQHHACKQYVKTKRVNNKKKKNNNKKTSRIGHSSSTPIVVKGFDYLFMFYMFICSYLLYCMTPVFSDTLARFEPVETTALTTEYFGGIYIELHDMYCISFISIILYVVSRYLLLAMWWIVEKLVLLRRYRRIVGNNVFSSQKCTNENFELVAKILMCTNWKSPLQAASGLAAVVQIFRPSAVLLPEIQKIITRITATGKYEGQSQTIDTCVKNLGLYVGHADAEDDDKLSNRASKYWKDRKSVV